MNIRGSEAVGIDLGTTYSSLAYVDPQGLPRVMCDSTGNTVVPSVVFFDDEEIVVGDVALSQAKVHADRCVQFIKVHMGEPWRQTFHGQVHSPESISALILSHLVREAEPQIGAIRQAVITVPAYFTEKRRRATQQAGEIAGLEVVGTLNEPMSAALAYGLHRTDREHFAAIYDLGGGTFDVTVVRITPNEIEELATAGNRELGGRDWDQVLVDMVRDDFRHRHGVDPKDCPQALQDLLIECEKAKRRLSRMAKTSIRLHAFGRDHICELTRDAFEHATAHLTQSTKLTTELALEDAQLDWNRVSRVVLVGGSTQMPAIRRMLKETSGIEPDSGVNPVVAVALGAAVYANMLTSGTSYKTVRHKTSLEEESLEVADSPDPPATRIGAAETVPVSAELGESPRVHFVTAHGVGVKTFLSGRWKNSVLIPKNTRVPVKFTKRFRTSMPAPTPTAPIVNKFIAVEITQGDTPEVDLAEILGTGRIRVPVDETTGNPVDVTLEFDQQGRLYAHAIYVKTGHAMDMSLEVKGGLKESEVRSYRAFMDREGLSTSSTLRRVEDEGIPGVEEDEPPMIELL